MEIYKEPIKIEKRDIILGKLIGTGCYSKVYSATLLSPLHKNNDEGEFIGSNVAVAVKVSNRKLSNRSECLNEVMNMAKLKHQNIVQIIGVIDDGKSIPWIVLEFMGNGTIFDYVFQKPKLEKEMILRIMMDIASGMSYIHSGQDMVHGDLHSKNCFLDGNGRAKVGDFGFASRSSPKNDLMMTYSSISDKIFKRALLKHCSKKQISSHLPNFRWLPPEYLLADDFDDLLIHKPGDVWYFGTLIFQLWSQGQSPFDNLSNAQMHRALLEGKDPFDFIKTNIPTTVLNMALNCWDLIPSARPTFKEILTTLTENF